jgi:hypothetical protein
LHIGVHFIVLLAIAGSAWRMLWPYLFVLALVHLCIDLGKKYINRIKPVWVVTPYVIDQLLHFLSILGIYLWIRRQHPSVNLLIPTRLAIYLVAFLVATYIWFISERILAYKNENYRREMTIQQWPRIFSRAAFLTVFLLFSDGISPLASVISLPYLSARYGNRMLIIDLAVTIVVFVFTRLALFLN